ncbi:MAG: hypothetical protein DRN91_06925 [Candidatus Alkanophagales archaeon]|nr:MAG: hypothetical protein DRN91_06925 [Candidatus Alkanophagales archaeon]
MRFRCRLGVRLPEIEVPKELDISYEHDEVVRFERVEYKETDRVVYAPGRVKFEYSTPTTTYVHLIVSPPTAPRSPMKDDEGTVTSATESTLTDETKEWEEDEWKGGEVNIVEGTGAGQVRGVVSNTKNTIHVSPDWTTIPDTTSRYHIKKGMKRVFKEDWHYGMLAMEKVYTEKWEIIVGEYELVYTERWYYEMPPDTEFEFKYKEEW